MKIILASGSQYRKELLSKLGISFEAFSPDIDEELIKNNQKLSIEEKAVTLATEKAKAIQLKHPNAIVIGSDQICHKAQKIYSKSGSIEKSYDILKELNNSEHKLTTAYCILKDDLCVTHTNITKLKMRNLDSLQIKKYLSLDKPIDCAGSYKIELNGISLFEKIETEDYTAIVGLPLIQLGNDLAKLGIQIPS